MIQFEALLTEVCPSNFIKQFVQQEELVHSIVDLSTSKQNYWVGDPLGRGAHPLKNHSVFVSAQHSYSRIYFIAWKSFYVSDYNPKWPLHLKPFVPSCGDVQIPRRMPQRVSTLVAGRELSDLWFKINWQLTIIDLIRLIKTSKIKMTQY